MRASGTPLASTSPLRDLRGDVDRLIWILPLDQGVQAVPAGGEQGLDALGAHIRDDDVANLVVDVAEEAVCFHLLGLVTIVIGRADVVDRPDLVAVNKEQVVQRYQALLAQGHVERVLVSNREDVAPPAIHDHVEDDVGDLFPACPGEVELQQLGTPPYSAAAGRTASTGSGGASSTSRAILREAWSAPRSGPGAGAASSPCPSP